MRIPGGVVEEPGGITNADIFSHCRAGGNIAILAASMSPSLPPSNSSHPCPYCGHALRGDYYFCPACSKPWRSPETGLGPAPEPEWDPETAIRKKAPEVYHVFACYIAAIILGAVFTIAGLGPAALKGGGIAFYTVSTLAILLVTVYATVRYREVVVPVLKKPGIDHPVFLAGIVLGALALGLNYLWSEFIDGVLHNQRWEHMSEIGSSLPAPMAFFFMCLMPGISEEAGFRGVMQTMLLKAVTPGKAIAVSSLLFAAAHFSFFGFPYLFLVGLLLGWVRHRTGSIYPGIIIHAAHNAVVVFYFNT